MDILEIHELFENIKSILYVHFFYENLFNFQRIHDPKFSEVLTYSMFSSLPPIEYKLIYV